MNIFCEDDLLKAVETRPQSEAQQPTEGAEADNETGTAVPPRRAVQGQPGVDNQQHRNQYRGQVFRGPLHRGGQGRPPFRGQGRGSGFRARPRTSTPQQQDRGGRGRVFGRGRPWGRPPPPSFNSPPTQPTQTILLGPIDEEFPSLPSLPRLPGPGAIHRGTSTNRN